LKTYPHITVAIPAWNEAACIAQTIESVLAMKYPKEKLHVTIINDGSTDNTKAVAEQTIAKHPDRHITLINKKNAGKGAALNTAIQQCKTPYFVVMDADSIIDKNALKLMLPAFDSENVAVVLPSLKVYQPQNILQKMQWYEYLINMFYKELMGKLHCVHVAPGPFSVYKTEVLRTVGGFDEHNITEDLEMAIRLQKNNYVLKQTLDAEVRTIAPDTLKGLYNQRKRWYKGSILTSIKYKNLFFNKNYGDFGLIQMPTIIISGLLALVSFSVMVYFNFKGILENVYHLALINFDLWTLLKNFSWQFDPLALNYMTISLGLVMFILSIAIFKIAHTMNNENPLRYGGIPLIGYLFCYFFVLCFVWIGVSYDVLFHRKDMTWTR
jgi:cellulose synthase/poly-beta-1,6-N-acetylglucosamine synthase-like glycosyltransferase